MAEEGRKRRGPYLQFLTDGSHQNVPRTTKYRWQKKIRIRTVDAVSCESDVPEEPEPLNTDCSVEDVDAQEESACLHLLEPVVASSSLDEDLQENDAFAFTDSDCLNSCAWFFNESESTAFECRFEEPALFAHESGRRTKLLHLLMIFWKKLKFQRKKLK